MMRKREAVELGSAVRAYVEQGLEDEAFGLLAPVLSRRIPFPHLEHIGRAMALDDLEEMAPFLDRIAASRSEGGWVIIAAALQRYLPERPEAVFRRTRAYIIQADVWYACDIFGERIPGIALLQAFDRSLALLAPWRDDANPWVRRTVGVAVHTWAKRTRGAPDALPQAQILLQFLEPLLEERDTRALKGIGWGLKTLGRYYPELTAHWLETQLRQGKQPRALMVRKAVTYLPAPLRARFDA